MSLEMNVLNLFNEDNVLGVYNAAASTQHRHAGLPVADEPEALNYVLTNGIVLAVQRVPERPGAPQRKDTLPGRVASSASAHASCSEVALQRYGRHSGPVGTSHRARTVSRQDKKGN